MTCRIGLPLLFYNIKCRGNHAFLFFFFELFDLFSTFMESPFGWVTFFPISSLVSLTFAFWDIQRSLSTLAFTLVCNKMAAYPAFDSILARTGYVLRDLSIA